MNPKKQSYITFSPSTNSFMLSPKNSIHQRTIFVNKKLTNSLKTLADDPRTSDSENCSGNGSGSSKSNLCK